MIKKFTLWTLAFCVSIYGCSKKENADGYSKVSLSPTATGPNRNAHRTPEGGYSETISVDTANRMIESYLYSINYPSSDAGLRSLSFNADSLRSYLKDDNIKDVKFMLAHQTSYINAGHFGENAGMNPVALTLVIVGTNSDGAFILNTQNGVFEHCAPCPFTCDDVVGPYIQ